VRAGDVVKHIPTGEEWLLLGVDSRPGRGHVYPAGWPPCRADMADCEFIEHRDGFPDDDALKARAKQWAGIQFDDLPESATAGKE